jgi:hypothetical protein
MVKSTGAIFRTMENISKMFCEHSFMLYVEKHKYRTWLQNKYSAYGKSTILFSATRSHS